MRYLLAIILPPVAVLLCGKPFQAMLNLVLTLCFWIPGVVHALFVVNSHLADVRAEKMIAAVKQETMRFIKESPSFRLSFLADSQAEHRGEPQAGTHAQHNQCPLPEPNRIGEGREETGDFGVGEGSAATHVLG